MLYKISILLELASVASSVVCITLNGADVTSPLAACEGSSEADNTAPLFNCTCSREAVPLCLLGDTDSLV